MALLQSRPETVWSNRPRPSVTSASGNALDGVVSTLLNPVRVRTARVTARTDRTTGDMAPAGDRFASPFEIETPPGAEGWQELYSYSLPFSEARRAYEDAVFWFPTASTGTA